MRESAEQILGRQHFHPRGRQLEGERQGIEPSTNRRHVGPFADVRRKSGCTSRTRSTKSCTAGTRQIGGRHPNPPTRGVRPHTPALLAPGAGAAGSQYAQWCDRSQEIRDQRRRVQHLLEIVEHQQRRCSSARNAHAPRQVERRDVRQPEASAIADATKVGSRMAASATNTTRVEPSSAVARAISSARRVFPTPPGPTSVMRRAAGSASQCRSVCTSASRPRRNGKSRGRDAAQFIDHGVASRCPRARRSASRVAPVRSSAADSARTVSTWGRRRSPRSSALTA